MKILINCPLSDEGAAELRALAPDIELYIVPQSRTALTAEDVGDVDVIYTTMADFDPAVAPRAKLVQLDTAAFNHMVARPVVQSAIPIANVSGAYSAAVAECALALLLGIARKMPQAVQQQRDHNWDDVAMQGVELYGKTIGIVGYGSIGRQIARLAQAFGMKVLAVKRRPVTHTDSSYRLPGTGDAEGTIPVAWYGIDRITEMLAQCDIAMITLPATPHTQHIIGARELDALPRHAWVLNVGRGPVVDEAALIERLRDGRIAAAGLDVFEKEPLADDNPLWDMPNVIVMPHVASWTSSQALRATGVLIENVRRLLAGEPLVNLMDREFLY